MVERFPARGGRFIALAVLLLGMSFVVPSSVRAAHASVNPTLRLVMRHGYPTAVAGSGWRPHIRIVLTFATSSWIQGVQLRATASGTFVAGAGPASPCNGIKWVVRDFVGHTKTAVGPRLGCATRLDAPRPSLTVLRGAPVRPSTQHRVIGTPGVSQVDMRVGETLYMWEPGTTQPDFNASVDATYLALVQYGSTAARTCPQVDCAQGFYWEWLAVRTGDTVVDLSPACRSVTPPCGRPDYAVRVHIAP